MSTTDRESTEEECKSFPNLPTKTKYHIFLFTWELISVQNWGTIWITECRAKIVVSKSTLLSTRKESKMFLSRANCTNHRGRNAFKSKLTRSGALASLWSCWSWNKHISSQDWNQPTTVWGTLKSLRSHSQGHLVWNGFQKSVRIPGIKWWTHFSAGFHANFGTQFPVFIKIIMLSQKMSF